jgi:hypothetical protein
MLPYHIDMPCMFTDIVIFTIAVNKGGGLLPAAHRWLAKGIKPQLGSPTKPPPTWCSISNAWTRRAGLLQRRVAIRRTSMARSAWIIEPIITFTAPRADDG